MRLQLHQVILALLLLAAWSRADVTGMSSPVKKATIEVAIFAGGEGMTFYDECKREYEKLHPEVNVNLYGDPRIDDKLRVRIIEGHTPDLTNAIELRYHELIKAGRVQAFDEWLDEPSADTPGKTWRETF